MSRCSWARCYWLDDAFKVNLTLSLLLMYDNWITLLSTTVSTKYDVWPEKLKLTTHFLSSCSRDILAGDLGVYSVQQPFIMHSFDPVTSKWRFDPMTSNWNLKNTVVVGIFFHQMLEIFLWLLFDAQHVKTWTRWFFMSTIPHHSLFLSETADVSIHWRRSTPKIEIPQDLKHADNNNWRSKVLNIGRLEF